MDAAEIQSMRLKAACGDYENRSAAVDGSSIILYTFIPYTYEACVLAEATLGLTGLHKRNTF